MNTEEFNKLSNFAKLVELCAVPCYAPRYVYLVFPNGKKHRLYVDSCEYVAMSDTNVDYEDIYDNIDDYEYPYNHVNRSNL
mgnify:CR=1 FL=1